MKIFKIKVLLIGLILGVILLEGINVYLSNRVAGTSIEVARLTQNVEAIEEKNTSLKSELLSYSSYVRVSSRAAELGFTENRDGAIMINAPLQVAIRE